MEFIREHRSGVTLAVKVVPNASRSELRFDERRLIVRLAAPPLEGKANRELIKIIAKTLRIPQGSVEILQGKTGREKVVLIVGAEKQSVSDLLLRILG
ncbi:DUF167 domain-containing protein [Desulfomonile tiedjei]|uniref:UPF0235 protein Desti_0323 n=1 Tax=Desulfomonile tiedjei (strain ATCC 49306 / DSM 6799 / DCB-1) TaxID=706587 RepID=I4C0H1_DESTA|nr:DUF167 domain-containing protein [Desulfomonile tiedjei]AFM23062.1 TIGR00251 family protein [Desulfomonile tiedjei DSM 6799]